MTDHQSNSDAYDSPWKEVLEHAFPEFVAFYFPAAYAQIDWARGYEFKKALYGFQTANVAANREGNP